MVLKINVRALLHMANERMCTRAYWEFRDFMSMLTDTIRKLDNEWACIAGLMVQNVLFWDIASKNIRAGGIRKEGIKWTLKLGVG